MKIWKSFSGDHSAKLRIIGTFKTVDDANAASTIFNALLNVKDLEKGTNLYFSNELMAVFEKYNFSGLNEHDPEQLGYLDPLVVVGKSIIVETDETDIQALLKVLIHRGAKIEIYSRHDYPMG